MSMSIFFSRLIRHFVVYIDVWLFLKIMADNSDKNNNTTKNLVESIPNAALLLQLLTNPTVLQQAASSITQHTTSAPPSTPSTTSTTSHTLVGIVDTSVNVILKCLKSTYNLTNNI